ncbi:MAG: hypothetical protein RBR69_04755 [Candidatus Cloacimonadaceae bacterium]|nr:hypothetical protein [Candidatus Cloacimonadaceae bacterium]
MSSRWDSFCAVAGNENGRVWKDILAIGYKPRRDGAFQEMSSEITF